MKTITIFIAAILVFGFLFIALSEKAFTQIVPFEGCCQFINSCENLSQDACIADSTSIEFLIDTECNTDTNLCPGFSLGDSDVRNVPTLTEWGLIAMAGLIGFIGLLALKRRKAAT